jgi:ribosomal protein S18 acetylase RimI-like enzyme
MNRETVTLQPLPWDSEMLDVPAGIIDCSALADVSSPEYAEHIYRVIRENEGVTFITVKLPELSLNSVNYLVSHGARLVDTELVFRHHPLAYPLPGPVDHPLEVRFMKQIEGSGQVFAPLAESMQFSRFFTDEHIPRQKAMKLWETSIINHCEGFADEIAVGYLHNEAVALVTIRRHEDRRIFLHIVGVLEAFRGQGVVGKMLAEVVSRYSGDYRVFVETQAINTAARKAYQRAGFLLDSIKYILHYWQ